MVARRGLLGDPSNFDEVSLRRLKRERRLRENVNIEKALWALELTAQLEEAGLGFVLKGGTAVQLVSKPAWTRFSVDVDICTDATREGVEGVLSTIRDGFDGGFAYAPRETLGMDIGTFISYRIAAPSIGGPSRTILLDAYLSIPAYTTRSTSIRSFFYDSAIIVRTPTVGALLGDKLTTIASGTVGRRLRDSRQGLEYAKHAFDIHRLLRSGPEPAHVVRAFGMIVAEQNRIRGAEHTIADVVGDLVDTCEVIATLATPQDWRPSVAPGTTLPLAQMRRIFREGVRDIRPFLVGDVVFGNDEFISTAGEAALLALSMGSERDMGEALRLIDGLDRDERPQEEARGMLSAVDREVAWFIEPERYLYSARTLAIWSEVVTRLNRG
jgi:hypothetical protein